MKKTTLKNYFNFLFLPFILTLIVISCKEDVEVTQEVNIEEHEHINNSVKHFTIDELPHLDKVLTTVSTSRTSRTASTTFGDLNLSDIIEYVNEDGKESYTFKIENPTNIESSIEFENLHLIRLPNDEGYLAFILRWKPNLEWYSENNYEFQLYNFTGDVDRFDLDYNFLSETTFVEGIIQGNEGGRSSALSRDVVIECTDNVECTCPGDPYCGCSWASCPYVYTTGCSVVSGGGGGGNNTGSGGTTGGTGTYISSGGGTSGTTTGGYVPNGNGGVVATPPTKAEILSSYLGVLTEEQIAWANNDGNRREYEQLMDYLTACPLTPASGRQAPCVTNFAFGTLALEALVDGDDVNYALGIIFDTTFNDYPCQKNIVESVSQNQSALSNYILDIFDASANVNLTYKVEDLPVDHHGQMQYNAITSGYYDINVVLAANTAIKGSDIFIASVMIHENVHAVLGALAHQGYLTGVTINSNLVELAEAYTLWQGDNSATLNEHDYMILLVDEMVDALKIYGESKGYTISDEYYNDIFWVGLTEATTFELLPDAKKLAITQANFNEYLLTTPYSTNGVYPVLNPDGTCN